MRALISVARDFRIASTMVAVICVITTESELPVRGSQQPIAARPVPRDQRPGRVAFARAVGALVPKVAAAAFERYGFHSAEIMTSWVTIVGGDLARLTRPQAIKWPRGDRTNKGLADDNAGMSGGATLIVACDPAFALDISYRSEEFADRINRYFGYRAVARIKLQQIPGTAAAAEDKGGGPRSTPCINQTARGADEPKDLSTALAALGRSVGAVGTP